MSKEVVISTALCLPAPEIEALFQGREIVAIPKQFIAPGRKFTLCSIDVSINVLQVERYYHSSLLSIAQSSLAELNTETFSIKAWARCEQCQILDNAESLAAISQLTIWTTEALQEILGQRHNIFLTYLRVYQLTEPLKVDVKVNSQFIALPQPITVSDAKPVLSDRIFNIRQHQLQNLQPPLHPQLEELQSALISLATTNPAAKQLEQDINVFLGWSSEQFVKQIDLNLAWITKIAEVGNSSDGNEFEKLVRRGLLKLGFTGSGLEPDSTGGAGGMDFYCEYPYPMVGECKATKTEKVSDGAPAQLLKIGMNHLGKTQYDHSIKLIVAAGKLNFYALRTATENQMNVISPETLQKLVELQTLHKNSINLLELKECLQQAPYGLAEDKVNNYIDKVQQNIKLRSQIVQALKELSEQDNENSKTTHNHFTVTEIRAHYNATQKPNLTDEIVHDLLIELSSPLTGYLGRIQGKDWRSDRFYFLRDLPTS